MAINFSIIDHEKIRNETKILIPHLSDGVHDFNSYQKSALQFRLSVTFKS